MLKGYVEIENLRLFGHHGVFPQERTVGNVFEFTITLCYDMERAASTDCVEHALNYASVIETVKEVSEIPSALLENLAQRIKDAIIERFPQVLSGSVCVAKPTPPVGEQLNKVAVTLQW